MFGIALTLVLRKKIKFCHIDLSHIDLKWFLGLKTIPNNSSLPQDNSPQDTMSICVFRQLQRRYVDCAKTTKIDTNIFSIIFSSNQT